MDGISEIVEAADSGWALAAIFLIGIYLLLWKYGGEMLRLSRENNLVTKNVADSIVTNHGSKNLGDAVDRLTESVWSVQADLKAIENEQALTSAKLGHHLVAYSVDSAELRLRLHELQQAQRLQATLVLQEEAKEHYPEEEPDERPD